ncbi:L,D-transpeptidase family protein [Gemmatimonas sp.]|uniref:L,D-transpeptidase family protein n=1 Tax=Gemmatimonas sp. TaxID=1962908 RepID=UPI0027BA0805|nr:L,D-transpeptidase family protein [Gemmatimonas sp.]
MHSIAWIPRDWHYQKQANKRKLGLTQLVRGTPIRLRGGGQIAVQGNGVVRFGPDGSVWPLTATVGWEIVADGQIVVPVYGTPPRKYGDVQGSFRPSLGDGCALHGTSNPGCVGQAVRHGCVRLRNEDIAERYHWMAVRTPVYIW